MGTFQGDTRLSRHTALVRALLASVALATAVALAGCQSDGTSTQISARALRPLSPEMVAELEKRHMPKESPILVRIFKEESELEVWKQDDNGQFAPLKTYPVCRWSGELGPKVKQGDRQAPEGFYTITPGQMNPNSQYYLAFNLGFPNAYDRANDRSGQFLMVHGDCSSAGCYAMTDDQISEIYALGRESFFGGQKAFQVQAYPFRMTALNMARHRNSPHMAFWRMIKEGSDHFEATRQEPKVDVCDKHYVFNAGGSPHFDTRGKCPAYEVPQEIASAVQAKQENDEREFASYVSRGVQTVAVTTGADGGMHPSFLAKLRPEFVTDTRGRVAAYSQPGSGMPTLVSPPQNADVTSATRVASADPDRVIVPSSSNMFSGGSSAASSSSEGSLAKVSKWLGFGSKEDTPPPPPSKPATKPAATKPAATPKPVMTAAAPGAIRPASASSQPAQLSQPAAAKPVQQVAEAKPRPPANADASGSSLMSGAAPVMPTGSFANRWGDVR